MTIRCNCPQKCEIHLGGREPVTPAPPDISVEDKLTLKELEAAALNAQLRISAARSEAQASQQMLNNYVEELFKKHQLEPGAYGLDLKGMKFVSRTEKTT